MAVQPSPLTLQIVLERIDSSKNVARLYVLSVEPTLFARDTLIGRWGRKGALDRQRLEFFDNEAAARMAQRSLDVTDVLGIISAVAAFGRNVLAANLGASFEVSTRVVAGRKPRGFDAADQADGFGGHAFLRSDVDEAALRRTLVDLAVMAV